LCEAQTSWRRKFHFEKCISAIDCTHYAIKKSKLHGKYNKIPKKKKKKIIERCFGQLKIRFPTIQNSLRIKRNRIPQLVLCCFILHNAAKKLKDPDFEIEEF
jgi:hypothetical protein